MTPSLSEVLEKYNAAFKNIEAISESHPEEARKLSNRLMTYGLDLLHHELNIPTRNNGKRMNEKKLIDETEEAIQYVSTIEETDKEQALDILKSRLIKVNEALSHYRDEDIKAAESNWGPENA